MKNLMGKVGLVLLVATVGVVCTTEAENLRDRVERLQAERDAKIKVQRLEKAIELEELARRLEHEKARLEGDNAADNLRSEIEELDAELEKLARLHERMREALSKDHPRLLEVRQKMSHVKSAVFEKRHQLKKMTAPRHEQHHHGEHRKPLAQKIEHLQAAAGHLEKGGRPELARELKEQAERLERELYRDHEKHSHQGDEQHSAEVSRQLDRLAEQMRDMQEEMEKLRDDVAELRQLRESK